MAIIVEEEKNTSNLTSFFGWFVIVLVLGAAGYYIFLATPAPAVVTPPAGFQNISSITQIQSNPESIITSPAFAALTQTIPEPSATGGTPVGKQNPFIP